MKIFKYHVPIADEFLIQIHKGARFLSVQDQRGAGCMWWLVDDARPLETRTFYVVGTGNPFDPEGKVYFGTFQQEAFVWHLFARTP